MRGLSKLRVGRSLDSVFGRALVALFALALFAVSARADGGVTLPDTGVDMSAMTTAVITKLGAIALVAVGGALAFIVIRKGIKWARSMA